MLRLLPRAAPLGALLIGLGAAAPAWARKPPPPPPPLPALQLGESVPEGIPLDDPAIPDAQGLWLDLIGRARTRVDLSQFYLSPSEGPDRLDPVLEALVEAAARGVEVRFLADAKFNQTYPDALKALDAHDGVEVRIYDVGAITGGVQHAKYFVVDGQAAWLGSQNFDWRSLQHILELGVAIGDPALAGQLQRVFDLDWALAGGGPRPSAAPAAPLVFRDVPYGGSQVAAAVVASPEGLLPEGVPWDWAPLLAAIDGAKARVRLQVMSYALVGYDKSYWDGLDSALRRAAARGVEVELIVADWSMDAKKEPWIKSLSVLPRTTVKVVSIPQPDGDFIEFGRVAHSKFLTVDGEVGWIGTSNAAGDYFFKSRNVGLLVRGAPLVADLDRRFELTWTSAYADSVKPGRAYHAPPRTRKDRDAAPKGDGGGKGDKAGG